MSTRVALLLALLLVFAGASPALAQEYKPVQLSHLAATPDSFGGKIVTGGYVELVGFSHFSEGEGDYEKDVASTTYKLWEKPELEGAYVFIVVEDMNRADWEDNLPVAPILVQGAYYQLEGEWIQRDRVASPEIAPGSTVWVLRTHGFD